MIGADSLRRQTLVGMMLGRGQGAARTGSERGAAQPAVRALTVEQAANVFKTLGHEGRLLILCHLARGERSVNELESILDARQSAVSQQLARLRMEGLVSARREGKTIHYSLSDPRIGALLVSFGEIFASEGFPAP